MGKNRGASDELAELVLTLIEVALKTIKILAIISIPVIIILIILLITWW